MTPSTFIADALADCLAAVRPLEPSATIDWAPATDYEALAADLVTLSPSLNGEAFACQRDTRGNAVAATLAVDVVLAARLPEPTPAHCGAAAARMLAMQAALLAARPGGGVVVGAGWPALCEPELLRRAGAFVGALTVKVRRVG